MINHVNWLDTRQVLQPRLVEVRGVRLGSWWQVSTQSPYIISIITLPSHPSSDLAHHSSIPSRKKVPLGSNTLYLYCHHDHWSPPCQEGRGWRLSCPGLARARVFAGVNKVFIISCVIIVILHATNHNNKHPARGLFCSYCLLFS